MSRVAHRPSAEDAPEGARRRPRGRLGRFRSTEGVAAVEFALILPLMVTLFFGLNEVTTGVMMDRKLAVLSRTLADLPSQRTSLSTSDLDNIFDAAVMTMRPYSTTTTQMMISSIVVRVVNNAYVGTVDWSCGRNLATPAQQAADPVNNLVLKVAGTPYTVPDGYQNTQTQSFLVTDTLLPYSPPLARYITSTVRLREGATWPVRSGTKVTGPGAGNCPAG